MYIISTSCGGMRTSKQGFWWNRYNPQTGKPYAGVAARHGMFLMYDAS